jgi:hypothetical protein
MKELFDQTTQMMEKSWTFWKQMAAKSPLMQSQDASFAGKWSSWISTVRSSYDINMATWKTFIEQSEDAFFRGLKQAPFYNEALEKQFRDLWEGMKKAQNLQYEIIKSQMEKMEELLRKSE